MQPLTSMHQGMCQPPPPVPPIQTPQQQQQQQPQQQQQHSTSGSPTLPVGVDQSESGNVYTSAYATQGYVPFGTDPSAFYSPMVSELVFVCASVCVQMYVRNDMCECVRVCAIM